jgi:glycosyltransferase involved in cell wall biosynthesis
MRRERPMRIAFYAPLKPPDHKTPSGDRRVARLLLDALRLAGHEPLLASRLRSFDRTGDAQHQALIAARGRAIAEQLIANWRSPSETAPGLWFTYHLYYKAPDWLGPTVSAALGIPYVVAEASHAAKRAGGPWDIGQRAVEAALRRADRVIGLNSADRAGVLPLLAHPDRFVALAPFLDARAYRAADHAPGNEPRLITVAMMRPGDKLESYRVLGQALASLLDLPWSLEVAGDGPAREEVGVALAPLGDRVNFTGVLGEAAVAERLAQADLFVWPAINEAFGMALLEAQASGVPVIAGNSGGVGDIVIDGETGLLTAPGDADAFATALRALMIDPLRRAQFGAASRRNVGRARDLPVAAARLAEVVAELTRACAA